jgi:flagellar motor switch protein FliG
MDKIRNAAIIMLGMGEKCAAEILKNMNPKEVEAIIEAINDIGNVSEVDVIKALNQFFKETNGSGIDLVSREHIKNSLVSAVEHGRIGSLTEGIEEDKAKWIELFKWQQPETIFTMIQDEHPQIISVIVSVVLSSEKASQVIKLFPKDAQSKIIKRMSNMGAVSTFAMDALSTFFESHLQNTEKYNAINVDGVEAVANIISYLDGDTEREIMSELENSNKALTEKIQEKILPFERLAQLDNKSLQTLLKEVNNDDLVLALKGADDYVKNSFMKNMSTKSAEILKDEMETKGPVKVASVIEAQKKIVILAKKLGEEEKIILSTKSDPDVLF